MLKEEHKRCAGDLVVPSTVKIMAGKSLACYARVISRSVSFFKGTVEAEHRLALLPKSSKQQVCDVCPHRTRDFTAARVACTAQCVENIVVLANTQRTGVP